MNAEDELYHELILELYRHPLNKKHLSNFDYHYKEFNPLCGDEVELFIKTDKNGKIIDIGFQGNGCAISQASASILTEKIKNKLFKEARELQNDNLLEWLGLNNLNPTRVRCVTLSLECFKKCI